MDVLGTHETLPKYTSQARDANLRHARPTKQLVNSWRKRAVLILIGQSIPYVNTPHVLSNQIV